MMNIIKMYTSRLFMALAFIILALLSACTKEAPIVTGFLDTDTATPAEPGYYYPRVTAVYPANGTTDAPANTKFIIVFNIPVNRTELSTGVTVSTTQMGALTPGTHYTIDSPGSMDPTTSATITFTYTIPDKSIAEMVAVTTTANIHDARNNVALNNPSTYTFIIPANAHPDTTSPSINTGGVSPADSATGIPLTGVTFSFPYSENNGIDISTLNSGTFYVESGGVRVLTTYSDSYNPGTDTGTITATPTNPLNPNTTYTVHIISGIKDLSGNALGGAAFPFTWSFTTTTATDPYTGAPSVTQHLSVNAVTSTSATVNWITSEPTNHELIYGTGTNMGLTPITEPGYYSNHTEDLVLTAGKRYWAQLPAANYQDVAGTTGSNSSPASGALQFNALTTETPIPIHDGSYSQGNVRSIPGPSGGAFLAWDGSDGTYTHIYGKKVTNAFTDDWAAQKPLFNGSKNYTYLGMCHNGLGGLIVMTAVSGSTGIYAKHITAAGAFDWGTDADSASDDGVQVTATNTPSAVYAVPVYTGTVQVLRNGTTDMGCLSMGAAPLYDSAANFSTVDNGDILINTSSAGTTVSKTASSDHRNVIGQAASIISAGNSYIIGDSAGTTYNADEYLTISSGSYSPAASTNTIYTITPASWGTDDIVKAGTVYVQLSADPALVCSFTRMSGPRNPSACYSPPLQNDYQYQLRDLFNGQNWSTALSTGYFVWNITTDDYAQIKNIVDDHTLDLGTIPANVDVHIFTSSTSQQYEIWTDGIYSLVTPNTSSIYSFTLTGSVDTVTNTSYTMYPYLMNGTAGSLPAEPMLDDNPSAAFNAGTALAAGDIVINWTDTTSPSDPNLGIVSSIDPLVLGLTGGAGIFSDDEVYSIIRYSSGLANMAASDIVDTGSATSASSDHLLDSGNTFGSVQAGDIAFNLTDGMYAMVISVATNNLTLSHDATFSLNDRYVIIRKRGILYVWQNGSSVMGKIMEMSSGAEPVVLRGEFTIATGTGCRAISDGMGNALVTYVDGSGEVQTVKLNGAGNTVWTVETDTQTAAAESIIDVQPDGTGGVFILYRYSSDTYVQHIDSTGTRWGTNGETLDTDGATSVTSQEQMIQAGTDVIVVANVNNDIMAWRRGTTDWSTTVTNLSASTQQNPKAYFDGTNCTIIWEDNRFLSSSGYGVFGLKVGGTTGTPDTGWDADEYASATDYNGVAIILNNFNEYWPVPHIVSYNGGTDAVLIWEDYRAGYLNDVVYIDLDAFTPY